MQICSFWCKFLEHIYLLYTLSSASVMVESAHTCVSSKTNAFFLTRHVVHVGKPERAGAGAGVRPHGRSYRCPNMRLSPRPPIWATDSLIRSTHSVI